MHGFFSVFFGWNYAGSGLPQGPFLGNNSFPLKVGLRWVFVNGLEWVKSRAKVGFWVQKWVKMGQNPLLHPLQTHFGIFTKTDFLPSLRGVEIVFQKGPEVVPTQHKVGNSHMFGPKRFMLALSKKEFLRVAATVATQNGRFLLFVVMSPKMVFY